MADVQEKVNAEWKDSPPPEGWKDAAPPLDYAPTTESGPITAKDLPGSTPLLREKAAGLSPLMTSPTQFEKDRPGKGISMEGMLPAMWDTAKGMGGGFLRTQLDPREFAHPERWPITRIGDEAKKGWERGTGYLGKIGESALSGAGGYVGMSAERAAEQGARGEGGAIMGEAAIPLATAIAGYAAPKVVRSMRPALQRMAYKELPTSGPQLTRGARSSASLIGAGGGALMGGVTPVPGGAYIGGHTGLLVGPSLMERIIGTPELGNVRNPGPFSKIPLRAPKMVTAKPEPAPSPFQGMTSSAKSVGSAELPPASPKMGEPPVKMVSKFEKATAPEPSKIIQPGSAEAKPLRVEGSYWSFKEPALRKAVLGGDRDAAVVYKQRFGDLPEGAGLLTDVAQGPTKGLYRSRN